MKKKTKSQKIGALYHKYSDQNQRKEGTQKIIEIDVIFQALKA